MVKSSGKLGVALLGLGSYSTTQIAPSFSICKYCELRGIITESHIKESMWKRKYNIPTRNVYTYQDFDEIFENHEIDIVYIATPNASHIDYAVRAAKAKKHVICEKPLAISSGECNRIIAACNQNSVKLSVGYRLCYSPYFSYLKSIIEASKKSSCQIQGEFSFALEGFSNWRYDIAKSGGGALVDLGIYGIYVSNYLFKATPKSVFVNAIEKKEDNDIESAISFELDFGEGKKASYTVSYLNHKNWLSMDLSSGKYSLQNAISTSGQRLYKNGKEIKLMEANQLAAHLDDFASSIINSSPIRIPGEMGLRDSLIIEALYQSFENNRREDLML